jgi:hypothetical protein
MQNGSVTAANYRSQGKLLAPNLPCYSVLHACAPNPAPAPTQATAMAEKTKEAVAFCKQLYQDPRLDPLRGVLPALSSAVPGCHHKCEAQMREAEMVCPGPVPFRLAAVALSPTDTRRRSPRARLRRKPSCRWLLSARPWWSIDCAWAKQNPVRRANPHRGARRNAASARAAADLQANGFRACRRRRQINRARHQRKAQETSPTRPRHFKSP